MSEDVQIFLEVDGEVLKVSHVGNWMLVLCEQRDIASPKTGKLTITIGEQQIVSLVELVGQTDGIYEIKAK